MGNFIIVLGVTLIILSLIGAALDANNKHLPVHNGLEEYIENHHERFIIADLVLGILFVIIGFLI